MPDPRARIQIVAVIVALAIAIFAGLWYGAGAPEAIPPDATAASEAPTVERALATVHVSGAVRHPGLVEVPIPARVADVVAAAGGATPLADLGAMNLAAPVADGQHVEVPQQGGFPLPSSGASDGVHLNEATVSELETLPGIGPVLADRIVDHRDANGPFEVVEDLLDVAGIGESTLAEIRDAIRVP
jgi:competence protein ComEA